jgi:hypothetical protein
MSELSMHELEAQTGEVLPEREALSAYFVFGSHNRITQVSHTTTVTATNASNAVSNGAYSSATSTANQGVFVSG